MYDSENEKVTHRVPFNGHAIIAVYLSLVAHKNVQDLAA
jgi:hypothetical protein